MIKIKDIEWQINHPNGTLWSGELLFRTYYTLYPIGEEGDDKNRRWEVEFGQFLSENDRTTLYIVPNLEQAKKLAQEHFSNQISEWIIGENSDWIVWNGGTNPVSGKNVWYKMREDPADYHGPIISDALNWTHDDRVWDIVSYKLA